MSFEKYCLNRRAFLYLATGAWQAFISSTAWGRSCLQEETPRQALGPFFPDKDDPFRDIRENPNTDLSIIESNDNDLTFVKGLSGKATGQVITIRGFCMDDACRPLGEAKILLWQASATGRYNHRLDNRNPGFPDPRDGKLIERQHDPHFQYWGHTITNAQGNYRFKTVVPGYYPADLKSQWFRPPHLHFMVRANGHETLVTQTYFKGDALKNNAWIQELNATDYILRDSRNSKKEQDRLIVEYRKDPSQEISEGLVGDFDFQLKKSSGIGSMLDFFKN